MAASMNAVDDYSRRSMEANSRAITPLTDASAFAYAEDPEQLANDAPPNQQIEKERPEHVLMCYMLASGKKRAEIAAATGYGYAQVCQIVRQPWFRKRFLRLAKEAGQNEVQAFLQSETLNSLETLVQLRDSAATPPAVKVASVKEILDRSLGKSVQHVKTESEINITRAAEEGIVTEKELATVEAEMKARGINPHVGLS